MSEIDRQSCIVEAMMVSNGNEDGAELEASAVLGKALGDAAAEGSGVVTIDCGRCGTEFRVHLDKEIGTAPVFLSGEEKCERPNLSGTVGAEDGEYIINLNVMKIRGRGNL